MNLSRHRGFTLLEMMITVMIAMMLMGITFMALQPLLQKGHVDSAYDTTLTVLRNTRQLSLTQSHEYVVLFNPGGYAAGTILVEYQPPAAIAGGALPPLQVVNTYTVPPDISFAVRAGFPAGAPDAFGSGVVPIDFGQGLGGASLSYVAFMPDGTSRDLVGNYNSGVVYLTRAADTIFASRAVTVWGATGRIRGWRLYNPSGVNTWVQQ